MVMTPIDHNRDDTIDDEYLIISFRSFCPAYERFQVYASVLTEVERIQQLSTFLRKAVREGCTSQQPE